MTVKIFLPLYGDLSEDDLRKSIKYYIKKLLSALNIDYIEVVKVTPRYTHISVTGDDAEVAQKYLIHVVGTQLRIEDLVVGGEYSGRVHHVDVRDVHIDIGLDPPILVRVPKLDILRRIVGTKKTPERWLSTAFRLTGISKHFPLSVKISTLQLQGDSPVMVGILGRRSLSMFRRWMNDRLDRVVVYGVSRSQLDKKIRKSRLHRRIVRIERLGPLEHAVVCRYGEFADVVAEKLTRYGVKKYSIFMPRRLRKMITAT